MKATFLFRFTPSLMAQEALEALFVQREDLARRITEQIRDSALTPSKYHTLLVGPRGIGKTHLVSLIYHRIRTMDDLRDHLLIAWLREEEWGVTSFLDLLLRVFRALLGEYGEVLPVERIESLYNLQPSAAERAGATLLKEFVGNRTLLVLVENLDDLFNGLGDKGQKRLRAYLQENPFCTILATAQSLFNGVSLQTSPFYGFFRIYHLEELTLEEATRLLTNIANFEGDHALASFISTPLGRARIRAVHHLAGGNHRVYVIFSQFLTRESLDEFVDPFTRTLDDLTPYYQARMAWLSSQQRKIVEFLCDYRRAVSVKEIAQRCFLTHQIASSQLKTLRDMGYVHSESVGRESYYELRAPLMRLCIEIKKNRGEPIRLLVDFLRLWYWRTELQQHLVLLQPDAVLEREYLLRALQVIEEEAQDPLLEACLKDYSASFEKEDFEQALQVAEELVAIRGSAHDWYNQGRCFSQLGYWNEALASYDKATELGLNHPYDVIALGLRSSALVWLGRLEEALISIDGAIHLDPKCWPAWADRGSILADLGRLNEAIVACDKAIELNPKSAWSWYSRARALSKLGRWSDALIAYSKVTELDERAWPAFFRGAEVLLASDRWDEGITALDNALHRFAHIDEPATGDTEMIVRYLLTGAPNTGVWRTRIATMIELYDKHGVLLALGLGLVESISALTSPTVSDATARIWRNIWQELAGNRKEFELPLRLLDAAVRYRETHDQRVLLELPIEERKLLEPLLEQPQTDSSAVAG